MSAVPPLRRKREHRAHLLLHPEGGRAMKWAWDYVVIALFALGSGIAVAIAGLVF